MEQMISKKELAVTLGISASELTKMVQKREIPFYRFGYRTIRFKPSEIEKYMNDKKVFGRKTKY